MNPVEIEMKRIAGSARIIKHFRLCYVYSGFMRIFLEERLPCHDTNTAF